MDNDTATEILEATYKAICQHGYADLSLSDIADETDRSKATIHYYYDSKENLFSEFLDFLYDRYTEQLTPVEGSTPREHLFTFLETVLSDEHTAPGQEFRTAMLEVKAQAPYDDTIRTQLVKFDEFLFEQLRDIITAGIASGEFDDTVEPTVAAEFLVTAVTGAHTRRVAVDHSTDRLLRAMRWYIETHIVDERQSEDDP
ncbi:TetR/AcrR family transcriptional regulator [Halanaeroarchaeum sulfurireducens]|nr:TetR/AcrR family transcriptional regulator [Halanaeroarchaeum sulfurireducens]